MSRINTFTVAPATRDNIESELEAGPRSSREHLKRGTSLRRPERSVTRSVNLCAGEHLVALISASSLSGFEFLTPTPTPPERAAPTPTRARTEVSYGDNNFQIQNVIPCTKTIPIIGTTKSTRFHLPRWFGIALHGSTIVLL